MENLWKISSRWKKLSEGKGARLSMMAVYRGRCIMEGAEGGGGFSQLRITRDRGRERKLAVSTVKASELLRYNVVAGT